MPVPRRGEVWVADLGTGVGHEQWGRRPVLVVSDDLLNVGRSGLLITCPLTSQIAKSARVLTHVRIDPRPAGSTARVSFFANKSVRSARIG